MKMTLHYQRITKPSFSAHIPLKKLNEKQQNEHSITVTPSIKQHDSPREVNDAEGDLSPPSSTFKYQYSSNLHEKPRTHTSKYGKRAPNTTTHTPPHILKTHRVLL